MTTARSDWDQWEQGWRNRETPAFDLDAMIARTRRARRGIVMMQMLSVVLTLIALGIVIAALRHAGNVFEKALGLIVSAGIAGVWSVGLANQRRAVDNVEAPADQYCSTRVDLCQRQVRFAQLGWAVVALDLVFLIPWWIGGFAIHGGGFHLTQLLTIWLPLAIMTGFVGWTMVLRRRALRELDRWSMREERE